MNLLVRHAVPGDVPALADFAARTFPLACPPELGADAIASYTRTNLGEVALRDHLADPTHTVLVAMTATEAVLAYALIVDGVGMDPGCAEMLHGSRPVGISKFYVDADLHGTGAAVTLLEAVREEVTPSGTDSLWLATNVGNRRALTFYLRNGFSERGHREFEVGGALNDDVVLERML